jgi:hypothetical protein
MDIELPIKVTASMKARGTSHGLALLTAPER